MNLEKGADVYRWQDEVVDRGDVRINQSKVAKTRCDAVSQNQPLKVMTYLIPPATNTAGVIPDLLLD